MYGVKGVIDRFGQIKPKVLFAVENYQYNGKVIDCREKIVKVTEKIPQIKKVILISDSDESNPHNTDEFDNAKFLNFNELLKFTTSEILFEQLPFSHPVYIMYSSVYRFYHFFAEALFKSFKRSVNE